MQINAVIVSVFVLMRKWCCLIDSEAFKVNLFHFFLNDVFFSVISVKIKDFFLTELRILYLQIG